MNVVTRSVEEIISSILLAHDDVVHLELKQAWARASGLPSDGEDCAAIMYAEDRLHRAVRELASMAAPNA